MSGSSLPRCHRPAHAPRGSFPQMFRNTIMDSIEVRSARGRTFEEMDGTPGSPDSALWARVPGHLSPSAAALAIVGDYVSGAASQPIGRRAMGRSLDNTLRMVQLKPTEWVLCDIRIHALIGGYAQGIAFLWSEDGDLLATASQSIAVRLWPEDAVLPELSTYADDPSPAAAAKMGPPWQLTTHARPGRRRPSRTILWSARPHCGRRRRDCVPRPRWLGPASLRRTGSAGSPRPSTTTSLRRPRPRRLRHPTTPTPRPRRPTTSTTSTLAGPGRVPGSSPDR